MKTQDKHEILSKPFNITSVCRADLLEILTEEQAVKVSDSDMERIASKMANAYCDNSFWIDLGIIAADVIKIDGEESNEER
jgi:hypothetical protein